MRYAPINQLRAKGQIFLEGPRTFAYIDPGDYDSNEDLYLDATRARTDDEKDGHIILSDDKSDGKARTEPKNDLIVWDAFVFDDGRVRDVHVGHAIQNKGAKLPTLDDDVKVTKQRKEQKDIIKSQVQGTAVPDWYLYMLRKEKTEYEKEKGNEMTLSDQLEWMSHNQAYIAAEWSGAKAKLETFHCRYKDATKGLFERFVEPLDYSKSPEQMIYETKEDESV